MKSYFSLLVFVTVLTAFIGCAPSYTAVPAKPSTYRSYAVGARVRANVGEEIIIARKGHVWPAWRATRTYTPPQRNGWSGGLDYPTINRGERFAAMHVRDGEWIGLSKPGYQVVTGSDLVSSSQHYDIIIPIDSTGTVMARPYNVGATWDSTESLFTHDTVDFFDPGSFSVELVYTGLTGSTAHVSYREYYNNNIRAPFTTDLNFDLAASKEIAYRSIRMRVEEVTPSSITLVVSDDGDLRWMPETTP